MNFNFNLPANTTNAFTLGTSTPGKYTVFFIVNLKYTCCIEWIIILATSGISFGLPSSTAVVAPNVTAPTGGFSFGAPAATTTTQNPLNFNFPSSGTAPAATTTSTLGMNLSSGTTATGFTLGAMTKPATTGLTFSLPNTSAPQAPPQITTSALPSNYFTDF